MYLCIETRVATTDNRCLLQVYRKMASADTCNDVPNVDFLVSTYFHMGYQYKEIISNPWYVATNYIRFSSTIISSPRFGFPRVVHYWTYSSLIFTVAEPTKT